jgi:hypothetical protein
MATTDQWCIAQKPLAEFAYELKKKYGMTLGQSKKDFLTAYDLGEIQLSTVYENLFVATRNKLGKPTEKISEDGRDFDNNGDMKTGVLFKNGEKRRFVVGSVMGKLGTVYFVGWNWMTNEVNFFAIPKPRYGFPRAGIKIPVDPSTGERTGGKYNEHAYGSWEEMVMVD